MTSLIPIALLTLFGVLTPAQIGASYGSPMVLLLLGGFILSTVMARSGAHLRIALSMVNLFGEQQQELSFWFHGGCGVVEHVDFQHSNHPDVVAGRSSCIE